MASKKAVLVYILEILRDETDANHTLSRRISSIYTSTAFLDAMEKLLLQYTYTN